MQELTDIASNWLPQTLETTQELIPGDSPNRSAQRAVIKVPDTNQAYVLEAVPKQKAHLRRHQAILLNELKKQGLTQLVPWISLPDGSCGLEQDGLFWQLRPFAHGIPLPRETYGNEGWRGTELANFLTALRQTPPHLTADFPPFSLAQWIRNFMPRLKLKMPALHQDLKPIADAIHDFLLAEPVLPIVPTHGDFHPNNAIWGDQQINAIIDWEFFGPKADGYDAANLLGCLGMDDPAFLTAPMAMNFLTDLQEKQAIHPQALHWLPDFIVAMRFAWMREWVWNKAPTELIVQELDFMWLILDNRELLRQKWIL